MFVVLKEEKVHHKPALDSNGVAQKFPRCTKKIALKICLLKHKKEKDTLKFASCKKISFKFCVLYSTTKKHPPQNLSVVPQKERKSPSKFSG